MAELTREDLIAMRVERGLYGFSATDKNGRECGHCHKTFASAEKCSTKIYRGEEKIKK
jgi:hypothetical protein